MLRSRTRYAVEVRNGPFASVDTKGGFRTLAASAKVPCQTGKSCHSSPGRVKPTCRAATKVSKAQLATFAKSPELAAARNAYAARALGKAALLSVSHRFALNLKGVLAYRKIGLGASVAKAHI